MIRALSGGQSWRDEQASQRSIHAQADYLLCETCQNYYFLGDTYILSAGPILAMLFFVKQG